MTYLAVAAGLSMMSRGKVSRLIITRPAVEAGERLGFLPGTQQDKLDPYMQPIYDALNDMMPAKMLKGMLEDKTIEVAPLAFMRGRTLSHAYIILDEAQNTTAMQMKMFLTRLGEGSGMAITGDPGQVDLPRGATSGLEDALRVLRENKSGIGRVEFSSADVVRHPLVADIVDAYERDQKAGSRQN
jgi:phosphate starvation-inducible PhoH-like protein